MAIPQQWLDNSELLDGIDRVSNSLSDCINLAETSLCKRKSNIKHEKNSPQLDRTADIFSGLDRIDDKIACCIKLAEDTLNSGRLDEQEHSGFTNPWATEEYNPRIARTDNPWTTLPLSITQTIRQNPPTSKSIERIDPVSISWLSFSSNYDIRCSICCNRWLQTRWSPLRRHTISRNGEL